MKLTDDEYNILANRHANSYESAQLRVRLIEEGLHFCSVCKTVKEANEFRQSDKGRGGRETRCLHCRYKRKGRKTNYIPTGPRHEENEARSRERDPEGYLEGKRAADRKHWAKHNERLNAARRAAYGAENPRQPKLSAEVLRKNARASKRKTFQQRKALGMTGRQANYMAPAPEFDESWNAIKR